LGLTVFSLQCSKNTVHFLLTTMIMGNSHCHLNRFFPVSIIFFFSLVPFKIFFFVEKVDYDVFWCGCLWLCSLLGSLLESVSFYPLINLGSFQPLTFWIHHVLFRWESVFVAQAGLEFPCWHSKLYLAGRIGRSASVPCSTDRTMLFKIYFCYFSEVRRILDL
jgi:hypothetical protein